MTGRIVVALGLGFLALAASAGIARAAADEATLRQARELAEAKRYDEALPLLDRVLEEDPDDARALSLRAEVSRRGGRTDDARADYERLSRLRPGEVEPWFWLGTIDRWRGRGGEALRHYGRALGIAPCHLDSLKGRARVLLHRREPAAAEADLLRALSCASRGDAEAAELLAEARSKRGNRAGAEEALRGAFAGADLDRRLGDLALASGRSREAAEHYRRALDAGAGGEASLLRRIGDAERERGRSAAAIEAYRSASRLDPSDTGSLYWIGILATRAGRRPEAHEAFDRILEMRPGDVGALVGKARLLHREGRDPDALALIDRALASSPGNSEALALRGAVLASAGRTGEARADYEEAIRRNPRDAEARAGLDRLAAARSFGIEGISDRTEVIEGLEDAGLPSPAGPIVPARVEYLRDGGEATLRYRLDERTSLGAELSSAREAVTNLDARSRIYDYDVLAAGAGLEHALSERWSLSWRLGGTRYEARDPGTIEDESRFEGRAGIERRGARSRFSLAAGRSSFIQRGFAGDFQFRIFARDRLAADWDFYFGRGFTLGASAGVSDFDDGTTVGNGSIALGWVRGDRAVSLRYRHDPFPARFLAPDRTLDFVNYDALSLTGRTPLGAGFRLSGEALLGRFGETIRRLDTGAPGPLDRNEHELLRATLAWSPRAFAPLTLGATYLNDRYDFDTSPYNTIDTHSWTLFAEIAGEAAGRWRYAARYARGFIGDERDPSYGSASYSGRLEARLGSLARAAGNPRLGVEARRRDNDLTEESSRYRLYLTVPF